MALKNMIEIFPNMSDGEVVDKLHELVDVLERHYKEEIEQFADANLLKFEYGYSCGKMEMVQKLKEFLSDTGEY
jgi:hypothetical protein